jgi:hypothetical protein
MKTLKELKENKEEITEKGPGLWANIRAKRQRIKSGSGERMRKPGEKGAPSPDALQKAKGTSEAATPAQQAAIAIAMKKAGKKPKDMKENEDVTEASKPRTPMRDFLRRYPVPKDQVAKPVKKEKPPEKKVEEQHPEDMKIPSNKLEPEGTKKWLAIHGKHLKYLKNLKKAPAYEEKEVNEAEGGGTAVPAAKQAIDAKKRAQILVKSAELKIKQEREREKLRKEREAVKEGTVPEFKSGGKPLAKKFDKAMAAMGIKAKIKMRTTNNISMNELFTEAMKKEKEKTAPTSKDKIKKGEALSGKKEPVEVSPEMSPTK